MPSRKCPWENRFVDAEYSSAEASKFGCGVLEDMPGSVDVMIEELKVEFRKASSDASRAATVEESLSEVVP